MQASKSVNRLAQLEKSTSKAASQSPVERLFSNELQQGKSDRLVSPTEVAASRITKGATQKKNRGLKPTWKHSPMMQALLSAHEGGVSASSDQEAQASANQSETGVQTVSGWGTPKSSQVSKSRPSLSNRAPTSRLGLRTLIDTADDGQPSVLPVSTLEQLSDLLSSDRSKDAYKLFGQSALKNSVNRSLLDSLRQASSSALPPVSTQSSQVKRLQPRSSQSLSAATNLASELSPDLESRLKLAWPLSSNFSEQDDGFENNDASSRQLSGIEAVQQRGELTGMERFAGQIKSSISPYQSNVNTFSQQLPKAAVGRPKIFG